MAGIINQVPQGLLSILDMKARGQAPRELASAVGGSIELLPFYLVNGRGTVTGTSTPSAIGYSSNLQVAQDELWWVHSIHSQSGALAAGTTYRIVPAFRRNNIGGAVTIMPFGEPTSWVAGEAIGVGYDGPWLMLPGDSLGLWCAQYTAGTPTGIVQAVDRTIIKL